MWVGLDSPRGYLLNFDDGLPYTLPTPTSPVCTISLRFLLSDNTVTETIQISIILEFSRWNKNNIHVSSKLRTLSLANKMLIIKVKHWILSFRG